MYMIIFIVTTVCLGPNYSLAMNSYQAGDTVIGEEYNETLKTWVDRGFSMWIFVDEGGEEYLSFSGDTGIGTATVSGPYNQTEVDKIEKYLLISKEWALVAKKNRVDTSKALGCYPDATFLTCERDGVPHGENQMGLSFFASNDGQRSRLIIDMADQRNMYKRATIYFELPEIDALTKNVRLIRETLNKAKETASKQNLFRPVPKHTPKD
jgi:hypothetical protein